MDRLQAQITQELQDIASAIEQLTGLRSNWSGELVLVPPDAPYKGMKPFACAIHLRADLALDQPRWRTLIHESFPQATQLRRGACMDNLDSRRRQQILTQALAARTSEQLAAATRELDAWTAERPEDTGISWAYEQMALVMTALHTTDAASQKAEEAERQALVASALTAQTPAEIERAVQMLNCWLAGVYEQDGAALAPEVSALHQAAAA